MSFGYAPVVAPSVDGRFELFIPWLDGNIYHKWEISPNSTANPLGTWSPNWFSHGSRGTGFHGPLALIANADGRLELFAGAGGELYQKWQVVPGGGWSDWVSIGSGDYPTVTRNADGRLELFTIQLTNGRGALKHKWQLSPNNGWSNWITFPPPPFDPFISLFGIVACAPGADGRLELFVSGISGNRRRLYRFFQTSLGINARWSSYNEFNGSSGLTADSPVLAANANKRLELFARGDRGLLYSRQTEPDGEWSNWVSSEPIAGDSLHRRPAPLASHANGRLALRLVTLSWDNKDQVVGKTQIGTDGTWTGWFSDSPPGVLSDPAIARSRDGRLYLFVPGNPNINVFYKWEKTPNGEWSIDPLRLDWPHLGHP